MVYKLRTIISIKELAQGISVDYSTDGVKAKRTRIGPSPFAHFRDTYYYLIMKDFYLLNGTDGLVAPNLKPKRLARKQEQSYCTFGRLQAHYDLRKDFKPCVIQRLTGTGDATENGVRDELKEGSSPRWQLLDKANATWDVFQTEEDFINQIAAQTKTPTTAASKKRSKRPREDSSDTDANDSDVSKITSNKKAKVSRTTPSNPSNTF